MPRAKSEAEKRFLRSSADEVAESFLVVLAECDFCERHPGSLQESVEVYRQLWWWPYRVSVLEGGDYKPIFWRAERVPFRVRFERLSGLIEMAVLGQGGYIYEGVIAQAVAEDPEFWRQVRENEDGGDERFAQACFKKGIDISPPVSFANLEIDMEKHCRECGGLGWDVKLGVCPHCGAEDGIEPMTALSPSGGLWQAESTKTKTSRSRRGKKGDNPRQMTIPGTTMG